MFPKTFFPQAFFTGVYFPPTTTFVLVTTDLPPLVNMVFNIGTMMGRR
jgi:hypothetical protein